MENATRAQQRLVDKGYAVKVDGDFGGNSIAALMSYIANRPLSELRTKLGQSAAKYFREAGIATPLRLAHVLAQQSVETGGFSQLVEGLNYSPAGLRATFSRARISDAQCQALGRQPGETSVPASRQKAIAIQVYGGAWGKDNLGNIGADDGWNYRGRGAKQTTGLTNYADVKTVTGIDVVKFPSLLEDPDLGMHAACIYWTKRKCEGFADADDIKGLTRAINGGENGLAERTAALNRAKTILL